MQQFIDHTLLKSDATKEQIIDLCQEAIKYDFKSVCIQPCFVKLAALQLKDTPVEVCTVIGFPLGVNSSKVKAFETEKALEDGADEVDMVINVGALKNKDYEYVKEDIRAVVEKAKNKIVKAILETCLLSDDEIKKASQLALEAGADFVKTSTGFQSHGATPEAVKIMLEVVKDQAKVKASGGIRSPEDAQMYIEMGVQRLGTSSGVKIMEGKTSTNSY